MDCNRVIEGLTAKIIKEPHNFFFSLLGFLDK